MGHSWASTAALSPSLVSEEAAREQLNLRSFARLTTSANLPLSAPVTAMSTGDGSVLPTVPVLQVLPGVIQVGVIIFLKYDFFIFIFCLFQPGSNELLAIMMMDMQQKIADIQAKQSGVHSSAFQPLYAAQAALPPQPMSVAQSDEEEECEEEFEEEFPLAIWSGCKQEFKTDSAVVFDTAKDFWAVVTGTDEKGRSELSFKKM